MLVSIAVIIYLHDYKQYKRCLTGRKIYGSNPLLLYLCTSQVALRQTLPLSSFGKHNADQLVDVQGFCFIRV